LIRLELRYLGKQQEKILEAKTEGLDSEKIQVAMAERADLEAHQLALQIMGGGRQHLPRAHRPNMEPVNASYDPKEYRR
jgi:hypothetical protein